MLGTSWACANDETSTTCRESGLTRREAGLKMNSKGKARSLLSFNKVNIPLKLNEFKYEGMVSDENLTLRGTTTMKNWLEVL